MRDIRYELLRRIPKLSNRTWNDLNFLNYKLFCYRISIKRDVENKKAENSTADSFRPNCVMQISTKSTHKGR